MYLERDASATRLIVASDLRAGDDDSDANLKKHRLTQLCGLDVVVACSGRGRPVQALLLELYKGLPKIRTSDEVDTAERMCDLLVAEVVPLIMGIAHTHSFLSKIDGKDCHEVHTMVGTKHGVFFINVAGMVKKTPYQFEAIGSGGEAALGCLYTLSVTGQSLSLKDHVKLSMQTAATLNPSTVSPQYVLEIFELQ